MLPPTIITAPTSDMARPMPASSATSSEWRQSWIRVCMLWPRLKPITRNSGAYSRQASSTIGRVSAAISGTTSIIWAITIAPGENSRPRLPKGPERDSAR